MDDQFKTLSMFEAKLGKDGVVKMLARHRVNAEETIAELSAMKNRNSIDLDSVRMSAHRLCGGSGSLGFKKISGLFDKMCEAADLADNTEIIRLIGEVEKENEQLRSAIKERYPEIE